MGKTFKYNNDNRFRKVENKKFDRLREERRKKNERREQAYASYKG